MSLNASPSATPASAPCSAKRGLDAVHERLALVALVALVDPHGRTELAGVGEQRGQLGVAETGHVLDVVRLVGLVEKQGRGSVMVQRLLAEEVRVAGSDDTLDAQQARVAVIGVQTVALPRVVGDHDVGAQAANPRRHLGPLQQPRFELAVGVAQKNHLAPGPQRLRCVALFLLA